MTTGTTPRGSGPWPWRCDSGADVVICAPETEQSTTSHSLTLSRPLRLRAVDEGVFAVDGTPADCVYVALHRRRRACFLGRPDLVVSGMNHGLNLGADVFYSGTVAAAREAALRGSSGDGRFRGRRGRSGRGGGALCARWPWLCSRSSPARSSNRGDRAAHQRQRAAGSRHGRSAPPGSGSGSTRTGGVPARSARARVPLDRWRRASATACTRARTPRLTIAAR